VIKFIEPTRRLLTLSDATDIMKSVVHGARKLAYVSVPYDEVTDGDVALITNDRWIICLHRSYDELKHTHYMEAPDGRRGDEVNWKPEAQALGRRWGDPMEFLNEHEFDHLDHLALYAPPFSSWPAR
jgi:hypothetical protein